MYILYIHEINTVFIFLKQILYRENNKNLEKYLIFLISDIIIKARKQNAITHEKEKKEKTA